MHIVLIHIRVKPEMIEAFQKAIIENAQGSLQEPGIVRFDVLQQTDDPSRFTLIEMYRQPGDQEKHRETPHYLRWKETAADMMAEARVAVRYTNLYPTDEEWNKQ